MERMQKITSSLVSEESNGIRIETSCRTQLFVRLCNLDFHKYIRTRKNIRESSSQQIKPLAQFHIDALRQQSNPTKVPLLVSIFATPDIKKKTNREHDSKLENILTPTWIYYRNTPKLLTNVNKFSLPLGGSDIIWSSSL